MSDKKFVLGDTPEQLNVKCANWVDAVVINGKEYTTQDVENLLNERDALAKEVDDRIGEFARLKQLVQTMRPDLHFVEFSGEWPQLSFLAKFKFEGCQYGGSVRKCHRKDDLEWFVANADKAAWDLLEATKQQGAVA